MNLSTSRLLPAAAAAVVLPAVLAAAPAFGQTQVILNEFNAVGSMKWLDNPDDPDCEGEQGFDCADAEDSFFGRVMGNGGDWIELFVVADGTDLRGWSIFWAETGNMDTTGEDIWFGNGDIDQGIITFSDDALWSNLPAGTIITITERTTAEGGLDTDTSLDPCAGDWWINVNSFDATYIATVTNTLDDFGVEDPPGSFSIGNDDWQGEIVTDGGVTHYGPVGEDIGFPGWGGSGVNSREVGRLETDPSSSVVDGSAFDDADDSTFGMANRYNLLVSPGLECPFSQDPRPIRDTNGCDCPPIILNEYNAVASDVWLNGGDANADKDGGFAVDTFFGRILANGGNWLEFVITQDDVDLREWTIDYEEIGDGKIGSIILSGDAFWADLDAGTIITIIERTTAEGGLDTDTSLGGGDIWANINSFDTQYVATTTSNQGGHVPGECSVGNSDYDVTIRNASGVAVFGPAGEGDYDGYNGRGIGNDEVCSLLESPNLGVVTPASRYTDNIESTFGAPNEKTDCESGEVFVQDFTGLPTDACVGGSADLTGAKESCPSPLRLVVDGATPDGVVAVLYATGPGNFTIPDGFTCAGTVLGLGGRPEIGAQARADATGAIVFETPVPAAACNLFLQAIDVATCATSNVVQ